MFGYDSGGRPRLGGWGGLIGAAGSGEGAGRRQEPSPVARRSCPSVHTTCAPLPSKAATPPWARAGTGRWRRARRRPSGRARHRWVWRAPAVCRRRRPSLRCVRRRFRHVPAGVPAVARSPPANCHATPPTRQINSMCCAIEDMYNMPRSNIMRVGEVRGHRGWPRRSRGRGRRASGGRAALALPLLPPSACHPALATAPPHLSGLLPGAAGLAHRPHRQRRLHNAHDRGAGLPGLGHVGGRAAPCLEGCEAGGAGGA